jgi:hypothetical protein
VRRPQGNCLFVQSRLYRGTSTMRFT